MKIRTLVGATTTAALACLGSAVGAPAWAANPAGPAAQAQLDRALALKPGGVQVSDNAVSWDGGAAVLVVPSDGEDAAPAGLGRNVRAGRLSTPALRELAAASAVSSGSASTSSSSEGSVVALGSASTCPGGVTVTDYYCFYQYRNYDGRRVQFTGATDFGYASDYGFNNGTTSWVSRDVDCVVYAYDGVSFQTPMWRQPENATSSYVGSANDNKLSSWSCA